MSGTQLAMPAFEAALRERRSDTDALLAQAHADGVASNARGLIGDLAAWEPVVAASPAPAELAVAVLGSALGLAARNRWTSSGPVRATLTTYAPALGWFSGSGPSAFAPQAALAALTQAASRVSRDVSLRAWSSRLSGSGDPGEWIREAIAVAAWRSGSARLRESALNAADRLPVEMSAALLEVEGTQVEAVLRRHRSDPWWWPGRPASGVVARLGDSICADGPWVNLPAVVAGGPTGWAVVADQRSWAVVADIHGATFIPLPTAQGLISQRSPALEQQVMASVPWADQLTGLALTRVTGPADPIALVSRAHSYRLDVVRVRP